MFRIRPAIPEDYYFIKECLEQHGKELQLTPQTGIMTADEDGFAGLGIYRLDDTHAEILEIITVDEQDWELAFFIGKAILNKVDLQGAKQVVCYNESIQGLLRKLEFLQQESGVWKLNLEGYFTSPCQRKKV
ncbi:MAG: hypothetical protein E7399_06360 [Ruminococcaceae bacterium]|nr:hypothetical protein [Oscillospiraceae bacterium]